MKTSPELFNVCQSWYTVDYWSKMKCNDSLLVNAEPMPSLPSTWESAPQHRTTHLRQARFSSILKAGHIESFAYYSALLPWTYDYKSLNHFKGAVSYRFSQGLLTLMCNNSELKADINFFIFCCVDKHLKSIAGCKNLWFNTRWLCYSVWGKTPVFHNSGFNSETILPISIFLFDNDTYMPSPQNGIRVCQLELYFWKYFIFCIKYIFFPVFSFSS